MNTGLNTEQAAEIARRLFSSTGFGIIRRVKGFINDGGWLELNATPTGLSVTPIKNGQEIIIVIGENLNKERINEAFSG